MELHATTAFGRGGAATWLLWLLLGASLCCCHVRSLRVASSPREPTERQVSLQPSRSPDTDLEVPSGRSDGSPAAKMALVELYRATGGSSWSSLKSWMESDPCTNSWYGVTCASGGVTALNLASNGLAGPLPTQIGLLTGMSSGGFDEEGLFGRNDLTGAIPTGESILAACVLYRGRHFFLRN